MPAPEFARIIRCVKEMLLLGRGGEGVLLASQILADTFARAGSWVQSFPEFTPERRGAPISAYLRWDEASPIHRRYKLRAWDVLVDLSPSPPSADSLRGVRAGGLVVLNRETRLAQRGPFTVVHVPASRIAEETGSLSAEGRPMGNMAVLGACVKALLPDGLPMLEAAIGSRLGGAASVNVASARAGYERCVRQHALAADPLLEPAAIVVEPALPVFPVSTTDARGTFTGTWSLERPAVTDACTACALCALFCPEGAISRREGEMLFDLLHCKGCGICEAVCPVRGAIELEAVRA